MVEDKVNNLPMIVCPPSNRFARILDQFRLKQVLKMVMACGTDKKLRVLDVGCRSGVLAQVLCRYFDVVGVDVQKKWLKSSRPNEHLAFVAGTIQELPFRSRSFDIIICSSVLEHLQILDVALSSLRNVVADKGVLLVGYPVETWLFKLVWRILSPHEFEKIDQEHMKNNEDYLDSPVTHKQTFLTIRKALATHFKVVQRKSLPFRGPDLLSYYECDMLRDVSSN